MDERMAELVLRAVERVPRGRVASYGDLAGLVGTGPRHVGLIMGQRGSGLPWWRITNASGDLPAHLRDEAAPHWADEGIVWKPNGLGCRIGTYRCDLVALADAWEAATEDVRAGEQSGPGAGYAGTDFYCDIAIPSSSSLEVVHEDDLVLAYHHTRPHWRVHIVVTPKRHLSSLTSLTADDETDVRALLEVVQQVARTVEREHGAAGVVTNLGTYQDSKHLHVHVHAGGLRSKQ